jgi:hypothetical protein
MFDDYFVFIRSYSLPLIRVTIAGNYWNSSHGASLEGKINHDQPWYCLEMHYHAINHDLLRCFLDIFT